MSRTCVARNGENVKRRTASDKKSTTELEVDPVRESYGFYGRRLTTDCRQSVAKSCRGSSLKDIPTCRLNRNGPLKL